MQKNYDFNYHWQFFPHSRPNIKEKNFSGHGEDVTIPHSPRIETLDVTRPFTGVMYYRKLFKIPSSLASKKLFIDFEGVMHKAKVYVNGRRLATHYGGYLPFSVDITSAIRVNETNAIVVEVDNRDDMTIPPGKPTDKVDFLYYGGIYRNVKLRAVDKVYIDSSSAKRGGGVFAYTEKIEQSTAYVSANVKVVNGYFKRQRIFVKWDVLNVDGFRVATSESKSMLVSENKVADITSRLVVNRPSLWDIDSPIMYTLRCLVYADDELVDMLDTKIGIRTVEVDEHGFKLNGNYIRLNGANRHQQFPYIGIAGSDNADYRDMYKLKEAGFNIVRLSHYPQSDALMDACDKLGLMVIVATPGWQHIRVGAFKRRVLENLRDMVRKDRNHPSAVMWEASLNETGAWLLGATDAFFKKCVDTIRNEFAPCKVLVCGDTIGRNNWKKIGYDVPFTGWDNARKLRILDSDMLGLTREYGDYEFGGHNSNTRIRRGDGEIAMRIQAHNFQWSHNMNVGSPYELGDIIWEGIDHNRGMGEDKPISTSGILNEWRLPKFSYYFFKSQRDDEDMVYIPSFWDGETNGKMTIYSNADEVELFVNGKSVGRRKPNNGETELFDPKLFDGDFSVDYWQKGGVYDTRNSAFDLAKFVLSRIDDGGNCQNLRHPPFTFSGVEYSQGEIKAIAYKGGKIVATQVVRTPHEIASIKLEVDYSGKALLNDGRDKVFVRAYAMDNNGTIVVCEVGNVEFFVEGGEVIGDSSVPFEMGIASAIIKADKGEDKVKLFARYNGLMSSIDVDIDCVNGVDEL